ncbi:carbon-nitrogen hydrolase [Suillus paluster]|uniref:carbon-nitrogen hydrolase n=1 Tax=Suillus paluster TaxID=48578 RepID=UPI001B870333|nr:carbon-nitrogen hydrolase [Suillus paluster]KAG1749902.1 carbon-nitrogen hydrolase [Suillus paluster]
MANVIRASVVQSCTARFNLSETLDKFESLTRLAKERDGTQLVVFPEAFIGGYPKGSTFSCFVGERLPEGRDEFVKYYNASIEIPSPATERIAEVSKATGVFVVMGVIERDGGTLYCTAIFVDPVEGLVAKHRKILPTACERFIWGQGDGSTLPVLGKKFQSCVEPSHTVNTKISATICWENYVPLLRTYYYSLGTQIYCAPTVDSRETWQSSMRHIAFEGRCFVLSACQFATEKDYPPDHAGVDASNRNPDNVMINGGSVIISPLGQVLAGPTRQAEDILTADLDLDDVVRGKFDLDTVGHYSRPDSTTPSFHLP